MVRAPTVSTSWRKWKAVAAGEAGRTQATRNRLKRGRDAQAKPARLIRPCPRRQALLATQACYSHADPVSLAALRFDACNMGIVGQVLPRRAASRRRASPRNGNWRLRKAPGLGQELARRFRLSGGGIGLQKALGAALRTCNARGRDLRPKSPETRPIVPRVVPQVSREVREWLIYVARSPAGGP